MDNLKTEVVKIVTKT